MRFSLFSGRALLLALLFVVIAQPTWAEPQQAAVQPRYRQAVVGYTPIGDSTGYVYQVYRDSLVVLWETEYTEPSLNNMRMLAMMPAPEDATPEGAVTFPMDVFAAIQTSLSGLDVQDEAVNKPKTQFDMQFDSGFVNIHIVRYINRGHFIALAIPLGLLLLLAVGWHWRRKRERRQTEQRARRQLAEGRESERLRLAQDLHDGPLQNLHAVRMRLAMPTSDTFGLQQELLYSIEELRTISENLRPPALSVFGLAAALRGFGKRFSEHHPHIDLTLNLGDDPAEQDVPDPIRLALFRFVQEALNNAAKHANASHITVQYEPSKTHLAIAVTDDGKGFAPPGDLTRLGAIGHYGLLGMSERAESIGARFDLDSVPGEGTTLRLVCPRFTVHWNAYATA